MEKLSLTLSVQLYKYGYKDDILDYTFNTIKELEEWISRREKETIKLEKEEKECGESLIKWTGDFKYKSKEYSLAIDL